MSVAGLHFISKYRIKLLKNPFRLRRNGLDYLFQETYFFAAGAAFAAAAGAAAFAAAGAAAAGAVASSCFNCLVNTTDAIGIRGEFSISYSAIFTSSTRILPFNSRLS